MIEDCLSIVKTMILMVEGTVRLKTGFNRSERRAITRIEIWNLQKQDKICLQKYFQKKFVVYVMNFVNNVERSDWILTNLKIWSVHYEE